MLSGWVSGATLWTLSPAPAHAAGAGNLQHHNHNDRGDETYTRRVDDIVERELSDEGVELEEEREGLADTA